MANENKANWRYEKKSQVSTLLAEQFLATLTSLGFCESYAPRQVNNLYYDLENLHCFHEHLAGTSKRLKLRIRWYGDFAAYKSPQLEIKYRDGDVGGKKFWPVNFNAQEFDLAMMTSHLPVSYQEQLRGFRPTLFNQYYRQYWQSFDGKVRVTLDEKIACKDFHSQRWIAEPESLAILEVKYSTENEKLGSLVLQRFPNSQVRFSKYVNGILRTYF